MSQAAMDPTAFAEVKALMGDALNDVLQLTADTLPEQLAGLEQAIARGDAQQVFQCAHRIKSASGAIGALGLARCAEAVEMTGRGGSAEVAADRLAALRQAVDEVLQTITDEIRAG